MSGREEYYMSLIKELEGISSILTGKEKKEFENSNDFFKQYEEIGKEKKKNFEPTNTYSRKYYYT